MGGAIGYLCAAKSKGREEVTLKNMIIPLLAIHGAALIGISMLM